MNKRYHKPMQPSVRVRDIQIRVAGVQDYG